jgi:hypothetical protein
VDAVLMDGREAMEDADAWPMMEFPILPFTTAGVALIRYSTGSEHGHACLLAYGGRSCQSRRCRHETETKTKTKPLAYLSWPWITTAETNTHSSSRPHVVFVVKFVLCRLR